jgi:hypothetical protein
MEIKYQINFTSSTLNTFNTDDFIEDDIKIFKIDKYGFVVEEGDNIITIERKDAIFDMFVMKYDGHKIADLFFGMGNVNKNDKIYEYLQNIAYMGTAKKAFSKFNMPRSEYFMVILYPIVLSKEQILHYAQLFYTGIFNGIINV